MQIQEARTNAKVVTRVCYDCGSLMEGRRGSEYNYTECGLQKVRLQNILVFRCKNRDCGAVVPEIPHLAELHVCIALSVIAKGTLLTSEEIRFLRKMANLSGVQMAAMLGIHKTALSRWENGARNITKKSDVALRLLCFASIAQERLRDNEVVSNVQKAAKIFSDVDLTKILQGMQEVMRGSKPVFIDPRTLTEMDGGMSLEETEVSSSIQ